LSEELQKTKQDKPSTKEVTLVTTLNELESVTACYVRAVEIMLLSPFKMSPATAFEEARNVCPIPEWTVDMAKQSFVKGTRRARPHG
jgi:hypothetical protein